jgi:hypothetical protein
MRRSPLAAAAVLTILAACAHGSTPSSAQRVPRTDAEVAAYTCARTIAAEYGFPVADGAGALANRRSSARVGFESTADGSTAWGWGVVYRGSPPQAQTAAAGTRQTQQAQRAWEGQQTAGVDMRRSIETKCRFGPAANERRPK